MEGWNVGRMEYWVKDKEFDFVEFISLKPIIPAFHYSIIPFFQFSLLRSLRSTCLSSPFSLGDFPWTFRS